MVIFVGKIYPTELFIIPIGPQNQYFDAKVYMCNFISGPKLLSNKPFNFFDGTLKRAQIQTIHNTNSNIRIDSSSFQPAPTIQNDGIPVCDIQTFIKTT